MQLASCRLITCIVPNDGTDRILLRALRADMQIIRASSQSVSGMAILAGVKTRHGVLPKNVMVRMLNVIVDENQADNVFDYIYDKAKIGRPGGGVVSMSKSLTATSYSLSEGVPDEE